MIVNNNPLEKLNQKYCGRSTCKILFAYAHGEQESKANLHFRSITQLAERLNRVMVLTNVGNSHIKTCNKFPFDLYYDVESLQKEFPKVKFLSEKDFASWIKERDRLKKLNRNHKKVIPPLSILLSSVTRMIKTKSKPTNMESFEKKACLKKFEPFINLIDPENSQLRYTEMNVAKVDFRSENSRRKFSNLLVKRFTTEEEIILMSTSIVRPLFPIIMPIIPYAKHIKDEAQKIKDKLSSSYIAIHWRFETSTPKLLPKCVNGLIKTLNEVMKKKGIENIYLATDYPLLSSRSQSSTFRKLTHYHHEAMRTLNETFKLNTWVSLGGLEGLRKDKKYKSEFEGAGISGILDKLVCIHSNYFISGPIGCSRSRSSFTDIIIKGRTKLNDSNLLNIVDRWKF